MTEDATQTGADELKPAYAARTSAMEEIANSVHERTSAELAEFDEDTGQVIVKAPPKNEEPEEVPAEIPHEEPKAVEPPPDDDETIVVDGKEVKVKRDQLLDAGRRTLQKESAADRRLQEATEALNRAKAYERSLLQARPSPDAVESEEVPSADAPNRSTQSTPDLRAIVKQELWLDSADRAVDKFKEDYSDIVNDPFAMKLVVQLENERLDKAAVEGVPLGDPWKAYKAHGEEVRKWLGKNKPATPVVSEDRLEQKRSTVTVVGAGARMPAPQTQKPLTTAEQIEEMRKARQGRPILKIR